VIVVLQPQICEEGKATRQFGLSVMLLSLSSSMKEGFFFHSPAGTISQVIIVFFQRISKAVAKAYFGVCTLKLYSLSLLPPQS
jgi:hypothetical protein